jgi:hypothetical protein
MASHIAMVDKSTGQVRARGVLIHAKADLIAQNEAHCN